MDNLIRGIRVLHQNAIRIEADGRVLYFDPYGVQDAPHDADYIFVTHDHYDHFSPGDIGRVSKAGTTVLLVEQNAQMALSVADRAYVLETGRVVMEGTGAELLTNERVRSAYLGG